MAFFSLLLLDDAKQVADLVDHPARARRVDDFHRMVRPLETEAAHGVAMILPRPRDALRERQLDFLFAGHRYAPRISSTVLPRLAAISDGALHFCRPSSVARTRLYGLVEP